MALPKRKTSKSKRNMRRSHDGIESPGFQFAPSARSPKSLIAPAPVAVIIGVGK